MLQWNAEENLRGTHFEPCYKQTPAEPHKILLQWNAEEWHPLSMSASETLKASVEPS